MKKREKLIKNIINKYNKKNSNNSEKTLLEKPAKDNEDPFLKEFKIEINKSIHKKENEKHQNKAEGADISNFENHESLSENTDLFDKEIINKIKIKTKEILKIINIRLFLKKKTELNKMIYDNILNNIGEINLTDIKKQKINDLINILIQQEINAYILNDNNHKNKELLKFFLNNIYPEIVEFYKKNEYEKVNKLSITQKKFLIDSFIEYLERKYLKKELKKNNISQNDYYFLKSKINSFILKQEKNYSEINIIKRLNKKNENL